MAESGSAQATANPELVRALGAFLWRDPARVLALTERLRKTGAILETRIRGGSMGTAVPGGSRLRIRVAPGEVYPVGCVVAFLAGAQLMVHRVVYQGRRATDHLITLGDALWLPDAPVAIRSIVGPVIAVENGGDWRPPGTREHPPWRRRLAARALVALLAGALELNVSLARGLARAAAAFRGALTR